MLYRPVYQRQFSKDSSFSDIIIKKRPADWNPNLADDYDDEYDAMEAENGVE